MTTRPFVIYTDAGKTVRPELMDRYAVKAHSRQPEELDAFEGIRGLATPRYQPEQLVSLLEASTAHYRACRQKAQDTAGLGWRFDKVSDDADEEDKNRLVSFFDELPPPQNAKWDDDLQNVFEAAAFDYEAIGRGALELVRVDHEASGPLETIVHIPAQNVRVHRDGIRFLVTRGGKRVWFKWVGVDADVDFRTGAVAGLGALPANRRATEIVWWRNYHSLDPLYGLPDVIPAVGAIVGDLGRRDFNLDFFSHYGIPTHVVTVTGDFDPGPITNDAGAVVDEDDPTGRSALERQIEGMLDKVRNNPHSSMVFAIPTRPGESEEDEGGKVEVKFTPLSTDVKEASFRLYRKDNREETLSSHGMSAALAGVFDAGAANRESLTLYKRAVIGPRQRRLERIVNRYIVRGAFRIKGWRWRLRTLEHRDLQRELDMWLEMFDRGLVTGREFIRHFAEPFGLREPPDNDPSLDNRLPADGGRGRSDRGLRKEVERLVAAAQNGGA